MNIPNNISFFHSYDTLNVIEFGFRSKFSTDLWLIHLYDYLKL